MTSPHDARTLALAEAKGMLERLADSSRRDRAAFTLGYILAFDAMAPTSRPPRSPGTSPAPKHYTHSPRRSTDNQHHTEQLAACSVGRATSAPASTHPPGCRFGPGAKRSTSSTRPSTRLSSRTSARGCFRSPQRGTQTRKPRLGVVAVDLSFCFWGG
jgi:hypothetical protein